jgi:hypothetical protein
MVEIADVKSFLILDFFSRALYCVHCNNTMKQIIRINILFLLLLSYVVVGVLGTTSILNLLHLGTKTHKITRTKANAQPTSKFYWTQHKHIPANVKISVAAPAFFKKSEIFRLLVFGMFLSQDTFVINAAPFISLHSSRAPPQV